LVLTKNAILQCPEEDSINNDVMSFTHNVSSSDISMVGGSGRDSNEGNENDDNRDRIGQGGAGGGDDGNESDDSDGNAAIGFLSPTEIRVQFIICIFFEYVLIE